MYHHSRKSLFHTHPFPLPEQKIKTCSNCFPKKRLELSGYLLGEHREPSCKLRTNALCLSKIPKEDNVQRK